MTKAELLKKFTDAFADKYGVPCVSALHHNKPMTNYHIHLIFSERKMLKEPVIKVASRNMFYDENGKHVRTKKEILDADGQVRSGCSIVRKGEIYEKELFASKEDFFKTKRFTRQVKEDMTNLINSLVEDEKEKLSVFDPQGIYLATKKIGKNNPMAEKIIKHNETVKLWNDMADTALIAGVPAEQIKDCKQKRIQDKVSESIRKNGNNPNLFVKIVHAATEVLQRLVRSIYQKNQTDQRKKVPFPIRKAKAEEITESISHKSVEKTVLGAPPRPTKPKAIALYEAYKQIAETLEKINPEYYIADRDLREAKEEYRQGRLRRAERKRLEERIEKLRGDRKRASAKRNAAIAPMGFQTVADFERAYSEVRRACADYRKAVDEWERKYLLDPDKASGIGAKLAVERKIQTMQKKDETTKEHQQNRKRGMEL